MAFFQPIIGAVGVVGGLQHRGGVEHAAWQVAQKAAYLIQRVGLVFGFVVYQRALAVHQVTAQFVLVDVLCIGLFYNMWPGGHHLGLFPHHHGEVRRQHLDGTLPCASAQRYAHHGHGFEQFVGRPAGVFGNLGAANLHQQLDAAPGGIDQPHQRKAQLVRHAFDVDPLVGNGGFGRPGADGEVIHVQADLAPVNPRRAHDGVGGVDALKGPLTAVVALACQSAQLAEAARVGQVRDAFAGIHAAGGLELGQGLGAAHGFSLAAAQCAVPPVRRPIHQWASKVRGVLIGCVHVPSPATSACVDFQFGLACSGANPHSL
jgi:hypothetical protein